jgi:GT2 family glycosyltransferase
VGSRRGGDARRARKDRTLAVKTLSIVIVSFNARADLLRCLDSLRRAPPTIDHHIVVVDNASSDDTVSMLRREYGHVRLMVMPRNVGFAAANNAGIRATTGDLILLLNGDTVVPPGAIDRLVARLEATPRAAIAGPRLVDSHGRAELSWGRMIGPLSEARQKLMLALCARGWAPVVRRIEAASRQERFVDWVSGACLLVRRPDAEAVGLLDERFFLYTEDVDFCAAVRANGRAVLFAPAAEIIHLRGRSRASAPAAAMSAYRRSHVAFYEKHHPGWVWLLKVYLRIRGNAPPERQNGEGRRQNDRA